MKLCNVKLKNCSKGEMYIYISYHYQCQYDLGHMLALYHIESLMFEVRLCMLPNYRRLNCNNEKKMNYLQ